VEFAFVALVIIVMAGGAFDYGMGWRMGLITNEAARAGARTGSSLGNDPLTDWYALSGARASLASGNRLANVQRVVVYASTTANGAVPASCTTGTTTSAQCNVLTGDQFRALVQGDFDLTNGCIKSGKATVTNWCSMSRSTVQLNALYYGVWIQTTYDRMFKLPSSTITVNRSAVMRIEPQG
jgi:Flp pilus assembly protein TadG